MKSLKVRFKCLKCGETHEDIPQCSGVCKSCGQFTVYITVR